MDALRRPSREESAMKKNPFVLGLLGASAFTLTATVAPADAQDRTRWKMQSAFASTLTHLGPAGLRFAKNIERMSGGKFEVKFYEPGALVPAARVLRRGFQGVDRVVLDDAGLSHRQVPVARLLHYRAVRALARASSWPGSGTAAATSCGTRSTPSTISSRSTPAASAPRPPAGSARRSSRSRS